MAKTVTGIDIGLRTNKFLRGFYKGNTFHVKQFSVVEHPPAEPDEAWGAGEPGFKTPAARVGLTGRDVNIRYTRVPRVPDWQLRKLMRFEVEEVGGQSGSKVASDFNVLPALPEIEDEDVVLLAMAREKLLDTHMAGLAAIGGSLDAFAPNSLALYNAWLRYGVIEDDTVLIANIGHENLDVILVRGPDLLFARNLSGGSKLFDEALAERFAVPLEKAERIKIEMATLAPGATYESPNHEKASRSLLGAAGQILSLLQSTLMFCKTQVKVANLRVDKVFVCGGGAALEGLPAYLSSGLNVPVELFEPFRVVDTSALDAESAEQLEEYRLEAVVALGLATMASDPDAYSVEVLPAKVRKRREFFGGTIWAVAAALLALLFLVYDGVQTSSELSTVNAEFSRENAKLRRAKSTHKKTQDLLKENAELAKAASLLQGVAGSGEQLARVLEHFGAGLPPGFWIEDLSTEWRFAEGLRVVRGEERPIIHMVGRTREGTESIAVLLDRLITGMKQEFGADVLEYQPSPTGDKFTLDFTLYAPPLPPEEGVGQPGRDDESAGAERAGDDERMGG